MNTPHPQYITGILFIIYLKTSFVTDCIENTKCYFQRGWVGGILNLHEHLSIFKQICLNGI